MDKGWSGSAWDPTGLPSGKEFSDESSRNGGQLLGTVLLEEGTASAKTQGPVWLGNYCKRL